MPTAARIANFWTQCLDSNPATRFRESAGSSTRRTSRQWLLALFVGQRNVRRARADVTRKFARRIDTTSIDVYPGWFSQP